MQETCAGSGLSIETASTLARARELLDASRFQVVISDQCLPDGDGIDLLSDFSHLGIEAVPVLMTGVVDASIAVDAINRGKVFKFIQKPLDLTVLEATVREARAHFDVKSRQSVFVKQVFERNTSLKHQVALREATLQKAVAEIRSSRERVGHQQRAIDTLSDSVQRAHVQTIVALSAAIEAKDRYCHGHSERVAYYSTRVAKHLGLADRSIINLRFASLLHDLGKIGIPDSILWKPTRLTPEELQTVKEHPSLSDSILKPLAYLGNIRMIVRNHHEWYDGSGYPDGLRGAAIPVEGRILSVADSYDAMRSDRPYRRAITQRDAVSQLKAGAGSQFCPACVHAMTSCLEQQGEYQPMSSLARPDQVADKWIDTQHIGDTHGIS
jgi:response regulator RpfG family c-di-GMP phosphodiesterase